ncbi:sensor histidine kinase [Streptomyces lateritius]|uniref:Sensor histidine kinase n=1 Tax=Streptomyces lateritius TaxID=67313 RepID=A0ABW6YKL4_9ACTN
MNSSTVTVMGSDFREALHAGLLRAAPRMTQPRADDRRHPSAPPGARRTADSATAGPVLWTWETEAILERFEERLPSALLPAEAEVPELRATLVAFARAVLLRVGELDRPDTTAATPPCEPFAAAPHQLVAAGSLLFECGLLHLLEGGAPRRAATLARKLGDTLRGADREFWHGDEGRADCRRLARQLHDELGGALTAARRGIDLATREPQAGARHLADAGRALDEACQETRALVHDLRHRARHPTLREALDGFLAGARPTARVSVRMTGNEAQVPERHRQEVFFVLREALRNSLQHATPEHIEVRVRTTRRWLYAKVENTGPTPAPAPPGNGLRSMAERMEDLGGRLRVSTPDTGGTRVEIHLPLPSRR